MELNGSGQPARPAEVASVRTDPRDDGGALRARMEVWGGAATSGLANLIEPHHRTSGDVRGGAGLQAEDRLVL